MTQTLGCVSLVVRDYDEALAFFTQSLGFTVVEDSLAKDRNGENCGGIVAQMKWLFQPSIRGY